MASIPASQGPRQVERLGDRKALHAVVGEHDDRSAVEFSSRLDLGEHIAHAGIGVANGGVRISNAAHRRAAGVSEVEREPAVAGERPELAPPDMQSFVAGVGVVDRCIAELLHPHEVLGAVQTAVERRRGGDWPVRCHLGIRGVVGAAIAVFVGRGGERLGVVTLQRLVDRLDAGRQVFAGSDHLVIVEQVDMDAPVPVEPGVVEYPDRPGNTPVHCVVWLASVAVGSAEMQPCR